MHTEIGEASGTYANAQVISGDVYRNTFIRYDALLGPVSGAIVGYSFYDGWRHYFGVGLT